MQVRRVVVGNDEIGRSYFRSDGPAPHSHDFQTLPGQSQTRIWWTGSTPVAVAPDTEPTSETGPVLPGVGGSSFVILEIAPDAAAERANFDPQAMGAEFSKYAPDITALFHPDEPGMHCTPTVDFVVVLAGKVVLELDGGARTTLIAGDTVVQLGGRHAWRNPHDSSAVLAVVLTGSES